MELEAQNVQVRTMRSPSQRSLRLFGIDITTTRGLLLLTVLILYILMVSCLVTLLGNNKIFNVFLKNLKLFHAYEYSDYVVVDDQYNQYQYNATTDKKTD